MHAGTTVQISPASRLPGPLWDRVIDRIGMITHADEHGRDWVVEFPGSPPVTHAFYDWELEEAQP